MGAPKEGWAAFNAKRKAYLKAYFKERHERDPQKARDRASKWYAENREKASLRAKARRREKPPTDAEKENKRLRAAELRKADPARSKDKRHAERARRRECGAMPSRNKMSVLLRNAKCAACGSTDHPEIDHILPLALGGTHSPANLQVLCRPCNRSKGAKHPDEWRGRAHQR